MVRASRSLTVICPFRRGGKTETIAYRRHAHTAASSHTTQDTGSDTHTPSLRRESTTLRNVLLPHHCGDWMCPSLALRLVATACSSASHFRRTTEREYC
jgi:hypothetical protein